MEILLNLVGGVALLLWGVRMVRTGIERSCGHLLRQAVSRSSGNRWAAFAAGLGITGLLQSSTATALIVSSFAGQGLFAVAIGLALMLGADVGSTLIVQLFSFNVAWISPLLISIGVFGYLSSERTYRRNLSRSIIGLGLILLSLKLVSLASAPLRETEGLSVVLQALTEEPFLAVLIAAVITWLAHSSVAVVLLVMSLAGLQVIALQLALSMVLGANLGAAITAVVITLGSPVLARRVPLGNLIMRAAGVVALVPLVPWLQPYLEVASSDPARMVANFHTGFNLVLAMVFLPLTGLVASATTRLLPDRGTAGDTRRPRYLDFNALEAPVVALASAARETLRMGDEVRSMLSAARQVLLKNDPSQLEAVASMDDLIDELHLAIKLYITSLSKTEMDQGESERSIEILSFTTNLEHIGDVVDKNLLELAAKRSKARISFSAEGLQELEAYFDQVLANLDLALNVFLTRDIELARSLLREKTGMRALERRYVENHFARIGKRYAESIESSALHIDILRDLKRINSYLTSIAYPILERGGELTESRLRETDPESAALDNSARETRLPPEPQP